MIKQCLYCLLLATTVSCVSFVCLFCSFWQTLSLWHHLLCVLNIYIALVFNSLNYNCYQSELRMNIQHSSLRTISVFRLRFFSAEPTMATDSIINLLICCDHVGNRGVINHVSPVGKYSLHVDYIYMYNLVQAYIAALSLLPCHRSRLEFCTFRGYKRSCPWVAWFMK